MMSNQGEDVWVPLARLAESIERNTMSDLTRQALRLWLDRVRQALLRDTKAGE